jgi:hypothetical protein
VPRVTLIRLSKQFVLRKIKIPRRNLKQKLLNMVKRNITKHGKKKYYDIGNILLKQFFPVYSLAQKGGIPPPCIRL